MLWKTVDDWGRQVLEQARPRGNARRPRWNGGQEQIYLASSLIPPTRLGARAPSQMNFLAAESAVVTPHELSTECAGEDDRLYPARVRWHVWSDASLLTALLFAPLPSDLRGVPQQFIMRIVRHLESKGKVRCAQLQGLRRRCPCPTKRVNRNLTKHRCASFPPIMKDLWWRRNRPRHKSGRSAVLRKLLGARKAAVSCFETRQPPRSTTSTTAGEEEQGRVGAAGSRSSSAEPIWVGIV